MIRVSYDLDDPTVNSTLDRFRGPHVPAARRCPTRLRLGLPPHHVFTTRERVNGGEWTVLCSWCGQAQVKS